MALVVYTEAKFQLSTKALNLETDLLKVMLVTNGYIVDPAHTFVTDGGFTAPGNFEVSGTGYTPGFGENGRQTLVNRTLVRDPATARVRLFGNNIIYPSINVGVVGGIVLLREGTATDSDDSNALLIGYNNEGGFPIITDGGELQIRWHINGILAF